MATRDQVEAVVLDGKKGIPVSICSRKQIVSCEPVAGSAPNAVQVRHEMTAVILDLDGVLTDTVKYHDLAWKQLADREGIYFDGQINERLKGISRRRSLEIILECVDSEYSESEDKSITTTSNMC